MYRRQRPSAGVIIGWQFLFPVKLIPKNIINKLILFMKLKLKNISDFSGFIIYLFVDKLVHYHLEYIYIANFRASHRADLHHGVFPLFRVQMRKHKGTAEFIFLCRIFVFFRISFFFIFVFLLNLLRLTVYIHIGTLFAELRLI